MTANSVHQRNTHAKERSGFFGELAKSIIALFAPAKDDYPATGYQPFTGDLNRKHRGA